MEDQDSILNELLEKIKTKERANESLKQQISKKKVELSKMEIDIAKPNKPEQNKIIINKKIPTDKEDEISAQKALANYKSLKMNQNNIKNNCVEYTIQYISQEHHTHLYIMGDFTKWEMTSMKKTKDIFSYKVILLKGFKYYYSFQAADQILLDYDSPYEEHPKTLQVQNFIDLNENNENKIFDSENDINILKLTEQNYFLSQLNIKEDEYLFLNKLKHHGIISKQIDNENWEKNEKLKNSIYSYYNELLKYFNHYSPINHIFKIKLYLKNRILAIYENNIICYYKIINITEQFTFECVKLYDCNHIKVNIDNYSFSRFYSFILPKQITFKKLEPNSKLYHILSLEESQKIIEEYNKDNKNIITAYFKTLLNLKNEASTNQQNEETIFNYRRSMIIVTPKKIEPEGINMDDYQFFYSLNRITKVRNKKDSSEVIFKVIDESAEKSKRPNRYEIYYGIINEKIYLIHCHVLDKDLQNIKMITKEIKINEDPHLLKKDGDYIKNNQLLLITKGQNILKLYYKGKKVKMTSVKIEENKLYILQSPNPDSIFNRMYVTVKNFSEKIKYDLIEQCNKFTYSFDNIQNGVDVQVSFDSEKNYVIEQMMLSVSPCLLKKVSSYEEHTLRQRMPKIEEKAENKNKEDFIDMSLMTEMEKYFAIAQKMVTLRKYKNKENIDKMTQEEKNKLNKELEEYRKAMEVILVYIEANEMWENIDECMSISSEINELIKSLNNK